MDKASSHGYQDERRRLTTHERSPVCQNTAVHSRSRSPRPVGSRSCSRHLRDRERELSRERERLRMLENEVRRERDRERMRSTSSRNRNRASRESACAAPPVQVPPPRRSRSRSRRGSRQRQRDNTRRQQPRHSGQKSRSRSPSFSSRDLMAIIKSINSGLSSQPPAQSGLKNKIDYQNILPNFDPSTKNQRIDVWLRKVNECATVYGWDDKTTSHFAMQKLQGLAKVWYEGLSTILFTWPEWQEKLLNAFPYEQNYGQSLEDMLKRKSKFNEPIETYYYEKLALINQCDITGKRAVDCIIHGISDRTMKSSALALRCSHPDQLLQFLMSNKDSQLGLESNTVEDNSPNAKPNTFQSVFCFNCKERGHPYLQCPKPLLKCNSCNRIGHKSDNCYRNSTNTMSTKNNTTQNTLCSTNSNPNT